MFTVTLLSVTRILDDFELSFNLLILPLFVHVQIISSTVLPSVTRAMFVVT